VRDRVHRKARPDASKRPRSVVKEITRRPGRIIPRTKDMGPTNLIIFNAPYSSCSSILRS
jgi:hypothetical protein